jgi:hypothetical protein
MSSARGRLADKRGPEESNGNQHTNSDGSTEVVRTRIRRSVNLVAQIQERLVEGGLGTEAFVYGIRG